MYKIHKASHIVVKRAEIDINIQPVIKWLNSFTGIFTRWCCEGDDKEKLVKGDAPYHRQDPYITFYSTEQDELNLVLTEIHGYGIVEVEFYEKRMIRYMLKFSNKRRLEDFIDAQLK